MSMRGFGCLVVGDTYLGELYLSDLGQMFVIESPIPRDVIVVMVLAVVISQ